MYDLRWGNYSVQKNLTENHKQPRCKEIWSLAYKLPISSSYVSGRKEKKDYIQTRNGLNLSPIDRSAPALASGITYPPAVALKDALTWNSATMLRRGPLESAQPLVLLGPGMSLKWPPDGSCCQSSEPVVPSLSCLHGWVPRHPGAE